MLLRYPRKHSPGRLRSAVLACAAALTLGIGTGAGAAAAPADGAPAVGAPAPVVSLVAPAAGQLPAGKPDFQLPFTCGTTWQLNAYDESPDPKYDHNPALDIVAEGNPGSDGRPVLASAAGKVSAMYFDAGSGNTIQLSHGNGWFTAYYHLEAEKTPLVTVGQEVKLGTRIGRVGATGNANGWAHLHYEQRYLASGDFTYERDRVPVHFNGVQYTGENGVWPSVKSANCATPQPYQCQPGFVCFYAETDGKGSVCSTDRNTPVSNCGLRKSYFNNGNPQEGYDHVRLTFKEGGGQCLHRGWTEGHGNFPEGGRTITSVTWGPECPATLVPPGRPRT
ncbi:peptidoglycan DD-metalloendopeptidase family protein [Streptomyces sp. NPDC021093]|uniref:peptidoglycan DD-metalloendopeptidase family protein n=1 Tax=Streptomyces sp. NPDC021093 TaxID=3365112 RepID=UPI0037BC58E2